MLQAYSLHSGRRRHCTMMNLFHNLESLQQLFEMPVLVEGMYPTRNGSEEYLMSTWQEYIDVMNSQRHPLPSISATCTSLPIERESAQIGYTNSSHWLSVTEAHARLTQQWSQTPIVPSPSESGMD